MAGLRVILGAAILALALLTVAWAILHHRGPMTPQAATFPDPAITHPGTALAVVAGVLAGVALGAAVAHLWRHWRDAR